VAAHALLQKREMVVALEAVRNCRLVVVDFNYFSLTLDPEFNDFPGFDSVKNDTDFSEEWRLLYQ
jgi:hypothetical protein